MLLVASFMLNFHVAISLMGIASGFVVLYGMLQAKRMDGLTALFLATTVATSVTGFLLPADHLLPSHVLGILSLVALAAAIAAKYAFHLAGAWRWVYVVGAVLSQYFNVFVLVVQTFKNVPALDALAPNQTGPVFGAVQLVVLVAFAALGYLATKKFHPLTPA